MVPVLHKQVSASKRADAAAELAAKRGWIQNDANGKTTKGKNKNSRGAAKKIARNSKVWIRMAADRKLEVALAADRKLFRGCSIKSIWWRNKAKDKESVNPKLTWMSDKRNLPYDTTAIECCPVNNSQWSVSLCSSSSDQHSHQHVTHTWAYGV